MTKKDCSRAKVYAVESDSLNKLNELAVVTSPVIYMVQAMTEEEEGKAKRKRRRARCSGK